MHTTLPMTLGGLTLGALTLGALGFSATAPLQTLVPDLIEFQPNTPALAAEVNQNFQANRELGEIALERASELSGAIKVGVGNNVGIGGFGIPPDPQFGLVVDDLGVFPFAGAIAAGESGGPMAVLGGYNVVEKTSVVGAYNPGNDTWSSFLINPGGGNVGINVLDPLDLGMPLVINDDGSGNTLLLRNDTGGSDWHLDFNNSSGRTSLSFVETGVVARMVLEDGGNVGIGTAFPNYKLHVFGDAGKPGGGPWTVASDRRLKQNIETLEGALDTLLALRGVTFEYKDHEAAGELPGQRLGFIAQEVEQVLPDWVGEGANGYKRLSIRGFEALAVEALRELAERNAELEARVERLDRVEAELAELQRVLATLVETR